MVTRTCRAARAARQQELLSRPLHGVITEKELDALDERNTLGILAAIKALGEDYLCYQPLNLRKES